MVFRMVGRSQSLAQDRNGSSLLGRLALTWCVQWDLHGQGVSLRLFCVFLPVFFRFSFYALASFGRGVGLHDGELVWLGLGRFGLACLGVRRRREIGGLHVWSLYLIPSFSSEEECARLPM